MKIILAALDKHLFPEYYPYFDKHFCSEKLFLQQYEGDDETAFINIAFMVKVVKLSTTIQSDDARMAAHYMFDKLVDYSFDWEREYDWQDLKAILLFFVLFSDAKSLKDIERKAMKPVTKVLMEKYQPGLISNTYTFQSHSL